MLDEQTKLQCARINKTIVRMLRDANITNVTYTCECVGSNGELHAVVVHNSTMENPNVEQ